MNFSEEIIIIDRIIFSIEREHLTQIQIDIINGILNDETYENIAEKSKYSTNHVKVLASKIYETLEKFLEPYLNTKITKKSFSQIVQQIKQILANDEAKAKNISEKNNRYSKHKNPILSSSHIQNYAAWLENKTRNFVGRSYVYEAFRDFVNKNKKGYFSVIGDPGEGKSTIVARYVLDNPCFFYFNSRRLKYTSTAQFLQYLCNQLIEQHNIEKSFTNEKSQDGSFLLEILNSVSEQIGNNQKIVIVVDALDEADLAVHRKEGSIALYLPEDELPDNIYFFLTWRRDKNIQPLLPNPSHVPSEIFDLKDKKEQCDHDIKSYIESYIERVDESNAFKSEINKNLSKKNYFIEQLTTKTKRNFMYITLVLPEMVHGFYKDLILEEIKNNNLEELKLTRLPDNLNRYYKDHWVRMGMMSDSPPVEKIYIIYVLSENGIPISRSLISKLSGQKETIVQWILDNWDQFLEVEPIYDDKNPDNPPLGYAFYHETYNDFLYSQEIIQSAGIDLQKLNAEVAIREVPLDIIF